MVACRDRAVLFGIVELISEAEFIRLRFSGGRDGDRCSVSVRVSGLVVGPDGDAACPFDGRGINRCNLVPVEGGCLPLLASLNFDLTVLCRLKLPFQDLAVLQI